MENNKLESLTKKFSIVGLIVGLAYFFILRIVDITTTFPFILFFILPVIFSSIFSTIGVAIGFIIDKINGNSYSKRHKFIITMTLLALISLIFLIIKITLQNDEFYAMITQDYIIIICIIHFISILIFLIMTKKQSTNLETNSSNYPIKKEIKNILKGGLKGLGIFLAIVIGLTIFDLSVATDGYGFLLILAVIYLGTLPAIFLGMLMGYLRTKNEKNLNKNINPTIYGIMSVVFGIIGLVFLLMWWIGSVFSFLAIFTSLKQNKQLPTKMAYFGLILGILPAVVYTIFFFIY